MNGPTGDLWRKLEAFELDDPAASLTFTRRLARENGWSHRFARRVVEEYKRFVFLAMTAGHEVTPSDEVDQAWHLHLTYTRSYWGGLCDEVLGRPLHHGPTKGGAQEGDRFEEQYERTLSSYRDAFGEQPPADIWPSSEARFGEAKDFVRVNRQRVWLLPKPWRVADRRPLTLVGAWVAVIPPLAAGAAWNPLDFDGPGFLVFYSVALAMAVAGAFACRSVMRKDDSAGVDELLFEDPVAIGALREGWLGAFHAAMAGLLRSRSIVIEKKGYLFRKHHFVAKRAPNDSDGPVERAILEAAGSSEGVELSTLGQAAQPLAMRVEERIAAEGVLETEESFQPARLAPMLLVGMVMLIGVAKFLVGFFRDKPVGFLFFLLLATVGFLCYFYSKPRRTLAGERLFKKLKKQSEALRVRALLPKDDFGGLDAAMVVAVFGVDALHDTEVRELRGAIRSTSADSGGCGSGDGDGCGGGGCGGCGGCGD